MPAPSTVAMEVPAVIACTPTNKSDGEPLHESLYFTLSSDWNDSIDNMDCCSTDSPIPQSPPGSFRIHPQPISPSPTKTSTQQRNKTQTVRVNVGGEGFAFPQAAFQRFLGLPWKSDSQGVFHLNSSPAVFEVLLDYTLFGTMPAYDTLSTEEFQEFETMALAMGGLTALIEHFDRKDSYLTKELRQGRRRRASTSRHFLINPEDSQSPSPNSISATRYARFLGAICGVAESIRPRRPRSPEDAHSMSSSTDKKRVKLAHEKQAPAVR